MTEQTIRDLLSYRLNTVTSLMQKSAHLRYKNEFGLSLGQWRAIALLAMDAPLSLNELARTAGLDRGQMSRIIKDLTDEGLVHRQQSPKGGKQIDLTLTTAGKRIYNRVMVSAVERDEAFLACLSEQELEVFNAVLKRLKAVAIALIKAQKST